MSDLAKRALRSVAFAAALAACGEASAPVATAPPPPAHTAPSASVSAVASATPVASAAAPATHTPPTCPAWVPTTGGDFTPASLAGLSFWLDTDPSTMVKDASGKTVWRDRTQHFDAQSGLGVCAKGPDYVPANDHQHGQFRYHGSSCLAVIERCPDAQFDLGNADFALFVVGSYGAPGALLTAFNQVPPESPNFVRTLALFGDAAGLHLSGLAKVDVKGSFPGAFHIYGIERRGDRVSVSVDGAVKGSATAKPVPTKSFYFFLGYDESKENDHTANPYLLGFMGDVVGMRGRLTDAQRSQLVAYLKKKFAPLVQ